MFWASWTKPMILLIVLSDASLVTCSSRAPLPLIVPEKTESPTLLWTGMLSPVIGLWSTVVDPRTTEPSTGSRSPGLTITRSPMASSSMPISTSSPTRWTLAVSGRSSARPEIACRVRSEANDSRAPLSVNKKRSSAPSSHSPIRAAPRAAATISRSMSNTPQQAFSKATFAPEKPPAP